MPIPARYSTRPVEPGDAAGIAAVLAAVEIAEPADEHFSTEDVDEELSGVHLAEGSVGVFDGDRLIGFGIVRHAADERTWRGHLLGGVDPEHCGRGIGGSILDTLLSLSSRQRDAAGDLPGEVMFEVEGPRSSAAALAASRGFAPWRRYFRMQRDLSRPIEHASPDSSITIRAYRRGDSDAVRRAYNAAFADEWGFTVSDPERWHAGTEGSASFRPGSSLLATTADGAVAGFLLVAEYDAETEQRGFRTGYIDVLGTVPAARGRRLATAMLARCLSTLASDGYAMAELGTEYDPADQVGRLYAGAGFTIVAHGSVVGLRF